MLIKIFGKRRGSSGVYTHTHTHTHIHAYIHSERESVCVKVSVVARGSVRRRVTRWRGLLGQ